MRCSPTDKAAETEITLRLHSAQAQRTAAAKLVRYDNESVRQRQQLALRTAAGAGACDRS